MTIKEAIDGCNWLKKYDYHADTKEVMDMAINALEDQEKHRWIPVSERLPMNDEYDLYDMNLVTLDNGDVCLGVYRLDDKVWYTRMQEGEDKYSTNHTVTAWMPLPEPYKGDKK